MLGERASAATAAPVKSSTGSCTKVKSHKFEITKIALENGCKNELLVSFATLKAGTGVNRSSASPSGGAPWCWSSQCGWFVYLQHASSPRCCIYRQVKSESGWGANVGLGNVVIRCNGQKTTMIEDYLGHLEVGRWGPVSKIRY